MAVNGVARSPLAIQRFHDISVQNIYGECFKLSRYEGKVVVIVNIAVFGNDSSRALQQMNELQTKYGDQIAVLGFPCNQFNSAETVTGEEILATMKYVRPGNDFHPQFQLLDAISVNGSEAHPLYQMLRQTLPLPSDDLHTFAESAINIKWSPVCRNDIADNFEKFIVAPNGKPYRRYSPNIQVTNLQNDIRTLIELFNKQA